MTVILDRLPQECEACELRLDEAARMRALEHYQVLDTKPELQFDRIVALAKRVLNVPIVMISLLDHERQWFKAREGLDLQELPRAQSFCDYAIRQRGVMMVEDATLDPRFHDSPLVTEVPFIRFYAGAPLITQNGLALGTLCVIDIVPRSFGQAELDVLRDLAAVVMDELELRLANRDLALLAQTDALTGTFNRRTFFSLTEREIARQRRTGGDVAVLMLDIDHFKVINDRFGHDAGDRALVQFACQVEDAIRAQDIFARLGGEEFALLLPDTTLAKALEVGERLRRIIEQAPIIAEGAIVHLTISLGAAEIRHDEDSVDPALRRADEALYRAKNCGRNCVIAA